MQISVKLQPVPGRLQRGGGAGLFIAAKMDDAIKNQANLFLGLEIRRGSGTLGGSGSGARRPGVHLVSTWCPHLDRVLA